MAGSDDAHLRKDLPGLPKPLQIRGLSALTAIILLSEIGDIGGFETSKQLAYQRKLQMLRATA